MATIRDLNWNANNDAKDDEIDDVHKVTSDYEKKRNKRDTSNDKGKDVRGNNIKEIKESIKEAVSLYG